MSRDFYPSREFFPSKYQGNSRPMDSSRRGFRLIPELLYDVEILVVPW